MYRRTYYRLQPSASQLHGCGCTVAKFGIFVSFRFAAFADVPPVRSLASSASGNGTGCRQILRGEFDSFRAIEIDINQPPGRLAEYDANV